VTPFRTIRRAIAGAIFCVVALSACTGEADESSTRTPATDVSTSPCPTFVLARNDGTCVDTFRFGSATYRVACIEVPELLLDVPVEARWGRGAVRAIAAVPTAHAVAVTADDATCGEFALAVRADLPGATVDAIAGEMERAASLPPDLAK
jgi:hypothetical protein